MIKFHPRLVTLLRLIVGSKGSSGARDKEDNCKGGGEGRGVAGIEMSRRGRVIIGYVNRENAATMNKKVLLFGEGVEGEDGGNPATWRNEKKREERIGTTSAFLRDLL